MAKISLKGAAVVDIGGGYGRLAPALFKEAKSIEIVDSSEKMLARAGLFLESFSAPVKCTLATLPRWAPTMQYDFALVNHIIGHLTPAEAVELLATVMKSIRIGGHILLKASTAAAARFDEATMQYVWRAENLSAIINGASAASGVPFKVIKQRKPPKQGFGQEHAFCITVAEKKTAK